VTKEKKETPSQKYSHFCTALEAIFKDIRFKPRPMLRPSEQTERQLERFQGGRR
jgi:hypothetical protein